VCIGRIEKKGWQCDEQVRTMDFAHDSMVNGRKSRTLNLMVAYTRDALAIEVDTSLPGTAPTNLIQNNSASWPRFLLCLCNPLGR